METQNYSNHAKYVPAYHIWTFLLLVLTFGGAVTNLVKSLGDHQRLYSAALLVALSLVVFSIFFFCRIFALKAQDRAIRAEENLRHYVLTGKLLDPRLHTLQVVALRFASDDEFPALAREAAEKGMTPREIKQAVKNWRADHYRV